MSKKVRTRLKPEEAEYLGFIIKENDKDRDTARYYLTEKQRIKLGLPARPHKRKFVEVIKKLDKNHDVISTVEKFQSEPITVPDNFEVIKISTSKTTGQQWIQYAPKKVELKDFDLQAIIEKHCKGIDAINIQQVENQTQTNDFDSLTYTDVHIGMDTDKYKNAMYPIKWNRKEIMKQADYMIEQTILNKSSDTLVIDELGDLLDGYNEQTTRGGHKLPQNMGNDAAFDCALEFKMRILNGLISHYKYIFLNNICNDNHAGSFGYFVNSAFKSIAEKLYSQIVVNNHRQFINHYFMGNVCFIITHGKDDSTLKFGFKPFLDAKGVEKIDQYCKHNDIYKKSDLVIFKKGDSHQALFDMCTSDDFYYFNYPALSPSSQWVQNNFKKGRRGFVIETFNGLQNTIKPYFIK
jgi:hypothetical protein